MKAYKAKPATQAEMEEYYSLRNVWGQYTKKGLPVPRNILARLDTLKRIVNPSKFGS